MAKRGKKYLKARELRTRPEYSIDEAVKLLKAGACPPEFLENVKELAGTMQVASKCGLGQTSPSAFLSILEGFGDEIHNRAASA